MSTSTQAGRTAGITASATRRTRAVAVAAATAATVAVWAVTGPLAGVDLLVRAGSGEQRVTLVAVVVATVLAGLAGWALRAALGRFTSRPRTIWTVTATAVLLLSLIGPLGSGVDAGARVSLAAMHLAAGAVLIPMLGRPTKGHR